MAAAARVEDRIRKLEQEKHVVLERMNNFGGPQRSLKETFRTSMEFLANPRKLWESGRLNHRQIVLKLVFAGRLRYARNEGFRPGFFFTVQGVKRIFGAEDTMVGGEGIEPPTDRM
jgi:hypothetical protein